MFAIYFSTLVIGQLPTNSYHWLGSIWDVAYEKVAIASSVPYNLQLVSHDLTAELQNK